MSVTRSVPSEKQISPARRFFTLAPLALVVVGAASAGIVARGYPPQGARGVHVAGLRLDDKSKAEARAALDRLAEQRAATVFILRLPGDKGKSRQWKREAKQLGLSVDVAATLEQAEKAAPNGLLQQAGRLFSGGGSVPLRPAVDTEKLHTALKQIAKAVNRKPKNARLRLLTGGGFGFNREQPGLALDIEPSASDITRAWTASLNAPPAEMEPASSTPPGSSEPGKDSPPAGNPSPNSEKPADETAQATAPVLPVEVPLTLKEVPADITIADLKQIDGELASFTTRYTAIPNRIQNVKLAASKINGALVRPGETFSYNRAVGPRDMARGFKEAKIIVKGRYVTDVGGGICQVSSTLYNAALRANLKIVQRAHHAVSVDYVPLGCDATVYWGSLDFRFQNNTDTPLYIAATTTPKRRRLSIRILGKTVPDRKVTIETQHLGSTPFETITTTDPKLPAGKRRVTERGHAGHRVRVYRVVRENGTVQKELLSTDTYKPAPQIVVVGARSPKPAPPAKPTGSPSVPTDTPSLPDATTPTETTPGG